jgi:hypothetical protein
MLILNFKVKFILNLSFSKLKICENNVFRMTNFISIKFKINLDFKIKIKHEKRWPLWSIENIF